jgi:hypothetical protein
MAFSAFSHFFDKIPAALDFLLSVYCLNCARGAASGSRKPRGNQDDGGSQPTFSHPHVLSSFTQQLFPFSPSPLALFSARLPRRSAK